MRSWKREASLGSVVMIVQDSSGGLPSPSPYHASHSPAKAKGGPRRQHGPDAPQRFAARRRFLGEGIREFVPVIGHHRCLSSRGRSCFRARIHLRGSQEVEGRPQPQPQGFRSLCRRQVHLCWRPWSTRDPPGCPFGTKICGWSNGARRYRTRSSVRDSRKATIASISSEVKDGTPSGSMTVPSSATTGNTLPPRL